MSDGFERNYCLTTQIHKRVVMHLNGWTTNVFDLINTGIFHFQIKTSSTKLDIPKIIGDMPDDKKRVIISRMTEKKGKRFMSKGDFVTMELDTFLHLLDNLDDNK